MTIGPDRCQRKYGVTARDWRVESQQIHAETEN